MVTRYTIDQILSCTAEGGQKATSPAVAPRDEVPFGLSAAATRTSPASPSSPASQTLDLSLSTGVRRRDEGIGRNNPAKWSDVQRPREVKREKDDERRDHHQSPSSVVPRALSTEVKENWKDEEEDRQQAGYGHRAQVPASTVARPVPVRLGQASKPTLHGPPTQSLAEPALATAHLRPPEHLRAGWRPDLLYAGGGRGGERSFGILEANGGGGGGGRIGDRGYGLLDPNLGGDVCGLMVRQYLEAHYRSLVAPRAFLPLGIPLLDPGELIRRSENRNNKYQHYRNTSFRNDYYFLSI